MAKKDKILNDFLARFPDFESLENKIKTAFELMTQCFDAGGKLLVCGNGGSAADSEHIVGELMKGFLSARKLSSDELAKFQGQEEGLGLAQGLQNALPAIALTTHTALITAIANDSSSDLVFAQQVWGYAKNSPDLLLALSTSGNSQNVVNAIKTANALGRKSIGITGAYSGQMGELCTLCIPVPQKETFMAQELMLPFYHCLCAMLEAHYFEKKN
ncbi:MAG: SIS domain-containing protein [Clostridiales bacterium]|nr:SIS domain-containing protein [Clostridiales bacterium]